MTQGVGLMATTRAEPGLRGFVRLAPGRVSETLTASPPRRRSSSRSPGSPRADRRRHRVERHLPRAKPGLLCPCSLSERLQALREILPLRPSDR